MRRRPLGFTLIELLIVVAIIGIVAAIAIPNLLNAIDRGKQKRTMADMRAVGTALEQYAIDFNRYPTTADGQVGAGLDANLEPTYIRKCPVDDGWAGALMWSSDGQGTLYSITSYGKGGQAGGGAPGPTTNYSDDIVFSTGSFTQWPEGQQR